MTEESKPVLTLVKGGRTRGTSRTGKAATPSKLTEKQERFAQGLAEGLTNSDAYRRSYDTSTMQPATIHNEAAKLAQHHGVNERVNAILAEKRAKHGMLSERQSDRVWRNVWRLAEGEHVPPSVQQAALALAAKMAGMLTDKVEIKNENVDSKSIESELLERLQRLTG